jgi:hypothetical protein
MSGPQRTLIIIGMLATIAAFAAYRVQAAANACRAAGGTWRTLTLECTTKPRPIILQRDLLRS